MSRRTRVPVSHTFLARAVRGTLVLTLLLLVLVPACRGPHPIALQTDEIAAHGTATFQAPREKVFRACVEALTASGYAIALEDLAQGVIVTERLQARSAAATRDGKLFLRRYELTLRAAGGAAVDVVAHPLLAESRRGTTGTTPPRERGAETVWKVEEERAEWRRLFGAVELRLMEKPAAKTGEAPPAEPTSKRAR